LANVCVSRKDQADYDYVHHRGYISDGCVTSITGCFDVLKGQNGI